MRLYPGKIPTIAQDIIHRFREDGDLEVSKPQEAQLDIEAVLKEYQRMDRDITEKAKDLMEKRGLPHGHFGRTKTKLAEERSFATGDEVIPYLSNQLLEVFMHSPNVDEVFTDDVELRKKIQVLLKKHMQVDEEMDQEVRRRIKNLQEGTAAWEVEYQKNMDQVKRKHKVD